MEAVKIFRKQFPSFARFNKKARDVVEEAHELVLLHMSKILEDAERTGTISEKHVHLLVQLTRYVPVFWEVLRRLLRLNRDTKAQIPYGIILKACDKLAKERGYDLAAYQQPVSPRRDVPL